MTNDQIIYNTVKTAFTQEQITEMNQKIYSPQQIALYSADPCQLAAQGFHTFAEWKRMGFAVKKGQHAALVANLWKYSDKPSKAAREAAEAAGEEAPTDSRFYRTKAYLFHRLQVEKIR